MRTSYRPAWRALPGPAQARAGNPRDGFGGPQPTIILSRDDEPKSREPRLHIDVNATGRDQGAEFERLLRLGAPADIGQTRQEPRRVLTDPEGNEFRLLNACLAPL